MLGLTSRTPSDLNACKFTCTEKKTKTKTTNCLKFNFEKDLFSIIEAQ